MNNLRQLLLIPTFVFSITALSATTFANTFTNTFTDPKNYYIAGNLGIFNADFSSTYFDQVDVIPQNIAQPTIQHGYTGGIAFGYRQECAKRYLLGGEISINMDGQTALFQAGAASAAFSDTSQVRYHADLVFVPGIQLSETLSSYLKLGLSWASIQDSLTSPGGYAPTYITYNSYKKRLGFAAGLGVSKALTDHVSIFSEAGYHDYGTVTFRGFQNFSANYTHSAHVYSYDVVVGASYQFGETRS